MSFSIDREIENLNVPKIKLLTFWYRLIWRSSRLSSTIKNLNEFPRSTRRAYFFLFLMPFGMILLLNEYSFGAKSFRDNRLRFILGWQWIMDLRFVCENGVDSSAIPEKMINWRGDYLRLYSEREKGPSIGKWVLTCKQKNGII